MRKIVTGCSSFVLLGATVAFTLVPCGTAAGQDAQARTIQLGDFGGRPTVEMTINGAGPFDFVLDTGSPSLLLDDTLAQALGLEVVGTQLIGAPGSAGVEASIYGISSATLDGLPVPVTRAIGIDRKNMPGMKELGDRPRGVMSFWLLGEGVSVLDMSTSTLELDPTASLDEDDPGTVGLVRKPGFPFPIFEIRLAGETLEAHIDTGSPDMFTLDSALIDRLALQGDVQEVGRARMVGREVVIRGSRLDGNAELGSLTIKNPEIRFIDRIPGVNVGSGLLREAIVSFDHRQELIKFETRPEEED
jgi:hypothetical protein